MSFKLDFSETKDFPDVQDGDYECVISNVLQDANPNTGTEFINFDLVIRNDIKQPFTNSHIFQRIYRAKDTQKYPKNYLMRIAQAAGLTDGKEYNSFEDFMKDFVGKPLLVRVKNETSEYNGKTYTNLNIKRWNKTKFPDVNHKWPDRMNPNLIKDDVLPDPMAGDAADTPEVNDDDLPF